MVTITAGVVLSFLYLSNCTAALESLPCNLKGEVTYTTWQSEDEKKNLELENKRIERQTWQAYRAAVKRHNRWQKLHPGVTDPNSDWLEIPRHDGGFSTPVFRYHLIVSKNPALA